ncbi:interleukin-15-like isoform X2 [Etheostoma cragini]|uniref:interleukin-15-like isoform X2 n=1 Tax=Etheostoma cragini TaxID=417921 RepID=UPI00155E84C2|nr:interleukin-15-like isoform X2 [Etheostoma cragini]
MTNFMTALPVILVQPTFPGDLRAKGVHFQSTYNLCRERHKIQVWLCFLVLSFLSTSTSAASALDTSHAHICLKNLKNAIEKSDAMLYAPSASDVKNCKMMLLRCYILELLVVIMEEEIVDSRANCIRDINAKLPNDNPVGCQPCEAYALKNITVFLDRLNTLLQEMNTRMNTQT